MVRMCALVRRMSVVCMLSPCDVVASLGLDMAAVIE